jgi:hypothetical protein
MNEIPIEYSQERALARLTHVMRSKLDAEVRALNLLRPVPLPVVEVLPGAVWGLGTQDDIAETMRVFGLGLFIMPDGAAELRDPRTGSPQVYGQLNRSTWRVLCLFQRVGAYQAQVVAGQELRPSEMVAHLAMLYKGAMVLTLAKYAVDEDAIHELKVLNSYADYTPNENAELVGRATLTIEITQNVLLPQPQWGAV